MKARTLAAITAAGAGAGTFAALASLPSGLGAGLPSSLVGVVLRSGWFWGVSLPTAGVLFALLLVARYRGEPDDRPEELWTAMEPLLWGAGAPLLSLILDPWFFHGTVFVITLTGLALGVLASLPRLRLLVGTARPTQRQSLALLVALTLLIPLFLVLPGPPWFHPLSGDEPHYLVIARSLWVDGDVDVSNEYADGLTEPFWSADLSPHAKPGVDPAARYSIHGSGLAVWLAPWYGAGRRLSEASFNVLARMAMSLWLAAAAVALFFLLRDVAGPAAALPGTALATLTLPLLFAGPHLFPAVPVLALSCGAYVLLRRASTARALGAGLLLACLPWLHFKFFGLMAAVAAVAAWRILKGDDAEARTAMILALATPLALSGAAHMAFTWDLYGRLSPLAIHVGADPILRATAAGDDWRAYLADPLGALTTAIGYLLDQREGLLFYAPHYLLAITGFGWMMRRRRADAIALALVFGALMGPYALSQEIGHWAPPARPITGVLWTLALPMGVALVLPAGAGRVGRARAAVRAVLVTWGICATVMLVLQADLLYHDYNVRRALVLLRYGAPGLPLVDAAPLWLGPDAVRWGVSLLGLLVTLVLGVFLWRWGNQASTAAADLEVASRGHPAAATRAATAFVLASALLMLWHHARVPVSALHQPWSYGGVRYWKPQSPPTRAWAEEGGPWTGGNDTVEMLLSSRTPIDQIVLELGTLAPMQAEVQLGRDRQSFRLTPGEGSLARFEPGPGRSWNGEYFYHLNVTAHGGISRAALGLDDDGRGLGVLLQLVQLEPRTP